ncbi:MAG: Efflux ABC transporter, permease protein [uncultured Corynebacteriales bacterium]|uniref:Transport permease protein n=1 Tax=uncultured Mycobacteriales bacterium TaxID=581187 RepID=A0A6J4K228_9ACTN|nr:MAG: Efflux ABC transporter, permease protein [uncultured Corynebacteriales bacterium]
MTALGRAVSDSLTMAHRSVRHSLRNLESLLMSVILPVVLLLMFVHVFGGAIDPAGGYVDYVVPGIILLCTGYGAASTAVNVNLDLTEGVMDRFRSMPILSSAVLTGHVAASVARNALATTLVVGVAHLAGFRPRAGVADWLAAAGLLLLYVLALSWVAVCAGLLARTVEGANAVTFVVLFLPYLSSAFVPTETLRPVLRAIAEAQPITPVTETLRGLLLGTPIGSYGPQAVAWCLGLLLGAYALASLLFRRRTAG